MAIVMNGNVIMRSELPAIDNHITRLPNRSLYLESSLLGSTFYVRPHLTVDFRLQQLRRTSSSHRPMRPPSRATLHIPFLEVTNLGACTLYLIRHLARTNATDCLAPPEIYRLAFKMAFYINRIALIRNFLGLHIKMDVTLIVSDSPSPTVIPQTVTRASPTEDTTILEESLAGEPVERTGASKPALERLKTQRFCYDSSIGTESETCAVCLEELSGGAFLTRMPCSHIFHESCVFEWLKKSNSCPLCRSELEA